ncbi:MAG: 3-hydroxyacyl-ACP dehydratase FabZ [Desulfobacteraceae bacterium]|nr:3-hydroxyacyl-ACP dehydratase FabZ [Desulfobacteraceae bacterium]MCB9494843.1 3-hydroxyacyl-ACP dehydratase FabZ [Desulfobacteraceae bacterium]
MQNEKTLNIAEILGILLHRYPFLMVDKILEIDPGKKIKGLKNVTFNEPYFQGHFPGKPVMPGVMILEAMAQTGALLVNYSYGASDDFFYLGGIDGARFRKPVLPGDQLIIEMEILKKRASAFRVKGECYVSDVKVCNAEFMAVMEKGRL